MLKQMPLQFLKQVLTFLYLSINVCILNIALELLDATLGMEEPRRKK